MPLLQLPFLPVESDADSCDHGARCHLRAVLPKPLQAACDEKGFLSDYLHRVPMDEVGVPQYYPKLSRALADLDRRNLIYPINDGLLVHIYPNDRGDRDIYIPIEPNLTVNLNALIPQVEEKLLKWVELIGAAQTEEAKRE